MPRLSQHKVRRNGCEEGTPDVNEPFIQGFTQYHRLVMCPLSPPQAAHQILRCVIVSLRFSFPASPTAVDFSAKAPQLSKSVASPNVFSSLRPRFRMLRAAFRHFTSPEILWSGIQSFARMNSALEVGARSLQATSPWAVPAARNAR